MVVEEKKKANSLTFCARNFDRTFFNWFQVNEKEGKPADLTACKVALSLRGLKHGEFEFFLP